ncbi:sensor histidine kinase [Vibrio vulnificus]
MLGICIRCASKDCEKSEIDTFDFCQYGVAFYNTGSVIKKKEESVTLRHISHNLRHELHKVLQTIVAEASRIDPTVSTKVVELDKPASKIVGATVIIDQFIEMIAGVNEFHPSSHYSANLDKKTSLLKILDKYSKVFSLIVNTRRSKNLNFYFDVHKETKITFASHIIEYIISIMMDNIWKYSIDSSTATISAVRNKNDDVTLMFTNISKPIIDSKAIFEKGFQSNSESEGFGYGLYWAQVLTQHYNVLSKRTSDILELVHEQQILDGDKAKQIFIIRNLRA